MGLEFTELIMACEEEFGVDFREHERALFEVKTVGDLHRCIIAVLHPPVAGPCPNVPVFFSLRRALVDNVARRKADIALDTRLLDLLPAGAWYQKWPALQDSLAYELPSPYPIRPMLHPVALVGAGFFGALILEIILLSVLLDTAPWEYWHLLLLAPLVLPLAALIVAISHARAPIEYHLPAETLRDLVARVVRHTHGGLGGDGMPWTDEAVWDKLRNIIAERLDVDRDRIIPETDFLKDLGAN